MERMNRGNTLKKRIRTGRVRREDVTRRLEELAQVSHSIGGEHVYPERRTGERIKRRSASKWRRTFLRCFAIVFCECCAIMEKKAVRR